MWFGISLLCFAGALYCWRLANEWEARKRAGQGEAAKRKNGETDKAGLPVRRLADSSTNSTSTAPLAARATNWLGFRLKNTSKSAGQLLRDDRAILLENALIDTSRPLDFSIPEHLRATGDPGSYIVQARGAVDDRFRAALTAAGAKIISYIPNNAYLVRLSEGGAGQMSASLLTQAVLPYEPAYKLKTELFKLAMETQPLPEGTALNVVVFEDARAETLAELAARGVEVLAESSSPFGPVLTVRFPSQEGSAVGWSALARLPGVDRKSTRLNSSHVSESRMPSSA